MKLVSLRMNNFMPYKGPQEIAFKVDGRRNVTIIYGDNMRGKTSILNAIRWCLYGKVLGRHLKAIDPFKLLNKDAYVDRDFEMQVGLTFSHKGIEYEVRRTMQKRDLIDTPRSTDQFEFTCVMRRSGEPISGHLIEDEINRIIPASISRFWLFDGELLQEYEQLVADATDSSDDIRDAIERALGVPALTNGRAHLSELLHRAQKQFSRDGNKDAQHAKLERELLDELEGLKRDLDSSKELHDTNAAQKEALEDELRQHARAEGIRGKIDEVHLRLKSERDSLENAQQRRLALAPRAWLSLVASSVETRREEVQAGFLVVREKLEDLITKRVTRRIRLSSLTMGECATCGEALSEQAKARLTEQGSGDSGALDVDSAAAALADATSNLTRLRALGSAEVEEELSRAEREIDRTTVEMNKLRARETELYGEIPGINLQELTRKTERRDALIHELGRLASSMASLSTKVTTAQRRYDALVNVAASGQQAGAQLIARKVRLLKDLSDVFEGSVENLRQRLRAVVQNGASQTFKQLSTEKQFKGLVINERYGLEIRDHLDRPVSVRSAGAEQIVALSLIDGLSQASGSSGMLVMDTPFGRLDLKHREHVLSYLPKMAEQVVLLVHEGELSRDHDLPHISDFVAGSYEIARLSPTQSVLERK